MLISSSHSTVKAEAAPASATRTPLPTSPHAKDSMTSDKTLALQPGIFARAWSCISYIIRSPIIFIKWIIAGCPKTSTVQTTIPGITFPASMIGPNRIQTAREQAANADNFFKALAEACVKAPNLQAPWKTHPEAFKEFAAAFKVALSAASPLKIKDRRPLYPEIGTSAEAFEAASKAIGLSLGDEPNLMELKGFFNTFLPALAAAAAGGSAACTACLRAIENSPITKTNLFQHLSCHAGDPAIQSLDGYASYQALARKDNLLFSNLEIDIEENTNLLEALDRSLIGCPTIDALFRAHVLALAEPSTASLLPPERLIVAALNRAHSTDQQRLAVLKVWFHYVHALIG